MDMLFCPDKICYLLGKMLVSWQFLPKQKTYGDWGTNFLGDTPIKNRLKLTGSEFKLKENKQYISRMSVLLIYYLLIFLILQNSVLTIANVEICFANLNIRYS